VIRRRGCRENREDGQSLVEVVAALGVVGIVLLGLMALATYSLRNINFARNQALATQYAQEGMEMIRQSRDNSPSAFFASDCSRDSETVGSNFIREINCELLAENKMKVTVRVVWSDAQGSHDSELITYLTKWK
jgi:type II secretory pathway pseudopilin PulG